MIGCFFMHRGYIKTWRKIEDWGWYTDSKMVHLLIHFILKANYKDSFFRGIKIKRGQLVSGTLSLSKNTGIARQSIRTCIERLKSTNDIKVQSTNKFSIITVCNYDTYQSDEEKINQHKNNSSNQQLTNNQPTTNQQLTTSKELKALKEGKERKAFNKSNPSHRARVIKKGGAETTLEMHPKIVAWGFEESWNDFLKIRKEKGKGISLKHQAALIAELEGMPEPDRLSSIRQSFVNNWHYLKNPLNKSEEKKQHRFGPQHVSKEDIAKSLNIPIQEVRNYGQVCI
jgi:hypothetical protein